jgi:hypothetical protein
MGPARMSDQAAAREEIRKLDPDQLGEELDLNLEIMARLSVRPGAGSQPYVAGLFLLGQRLVGERKRRVSFPGFLGGAG